MKAHASLRTYAEFLEHSVVLYTGNVCRLTLVGKLRLLAPLGSCPCISIAQYHTYAIHTLISCAGSNTVLRFLIV